MERPIDADKETAALKRALLETFEKYIKLNKKVPQEALTTVNGIEDLSHLADVVASYVNMRLDLKQSLLEIGKADERIEKLIELINGEIDIMYIEKKIQGKVRKQMEKTQKEYYLNEQMKVIKKELGQNDDTADEIEEFTRSIEEARMSKEAKAKALKEVKRLEKMPPFPRNRRSYERISNGCATFPGTENRGQPRHRSCDGRAERDHYGLDEVKERNHRVIAVRHLSKKLRAHPLLRGASGRRKDLAGALRGARLGRKFVRMSLGGVRDEAEIRGHRRTYVGALRAESSR